MIIYLINSLLCAFLLYLAYSLLLEGEKMHHFKRWFLLGSLVFSMAIPLLTVDISFLPINEHIQTYQVMFEEVNPVQQQDIINEGTALSTDQVEQKDSPANQLSVILGSVYCLITSFFLLRFFRNIYIMNKQGKGCPHTYYRNVKLVLVDERLIPHSFGNSIYVNKDNYEQGKIAEEILMHEYSHVRQKHSLDIIFIELLISLFWFNPFMYLFRNKIRLNHEFLADEGVIYRNKDIIPAYQTLLVNTIDQHKSTRISCNFNYLETKKRLIMMTKKTSPRRAFYKKIALAPVIIAAICIFSAKTTAGILPEKAIESTSSMVDEQMVYPGKGLSETELNEYKQIVSKYCTPEEISKGNMRFGWKPTPISQENKDRLYVLYVQMNKTQRLEQIIGFEGPLCNHRLRTPDVQQWKKCKNQGEIWLDGKKCSKPTLDALNRNDISYFLFKTADKDAAGVYLWTKKGYDEYVQQYGQQISTEKLLEIRPMVWFTLETGQKNGEKIVKVSSRTAN